MGELCTTVLLLLLLFAFFVQVRQWNIWGLPKDDLSTENAIAIDKGELCTRNIALMPAARRSCNASADAKIMLCRACSEKWTCMF